MQRANLYSDTIDISYSPNQTVFNYNYGQNFDASRLCVPTSKVEIKVSCKNLPNYDNASKTDARVYAYYEDKKYDGTQVISDWVLIGATELVKNDLNPQFAQSFILDYFFQCAQELRFVIMDVDDGSPNMEDNDFIGYVDKSISDIISSNRDGVSSFPINGETPNGMNIKKKRGSALKNASLCINIELIRDYNINAILDVSGIHLDKKDVLGKSDPFFIVSKQTQDGNWAKVYESTVIKNTLDPKWPKMKIPLLSLNSNDNKRLLKWDVYDWDSNTENDYIGGFEANLDTIREQKKFELINPKKVSKKDYKNSGTFVFDNISVSDEAEISRIRTGNLFSSFPMGGTEIAVSFAIDFTGSNGNPKDSKSLHYINPSYDPNNFYSMNDYQKAISAIGYVLEPYDTNKLFEVYGYGGCFNKSSSASFSYPLNGNKENPSVSGVKGVLDIYSETLKNVKLSGPTNFEPMIRKMRESTSKSCISTPDANGKKALLKYNILVFITDGVISDMVNTVKEIKRASECPISIIIIGVGNSNFDKMERLDGDNIDQGNSRDIVQFVPLNKFIDNPVKISTETLAEVPTQMISFIEKNNLVPPCDLRQ